MQPPPRAVEKEGEQASWICGSGHAGPARLGTASDDEGGGDGGPRAEEEAARRKKADLSILRLEAALGEA